MSFSLVKPAYAQSLSEFYKPGQAIGTNVTLGELLSPLVQNAIILAGLASLIVIIAAGVQYISASGEPAKVEQAQKMLTYAIVGLVLAVAAYTITQIAVKILGGTF